MRAKLFVEQWQRQSKVAKNLLSDAKIAAEIVDIGDTFYGRDVLKSVSGDYKVPVLAVDGVIYRGLEGVRRFLAR